jgi:hypothetical protein
VHFQENPTKSAYFDELMIYFVSYVLGVAKENSENAISDHLETPNFLNVLPSFLRNCHLRSGVAKGRRGGRPPPQSQKKHYLKKAKSGEKLGGGGTRYIPEAETD